MIDKGIILAGGKGTRMSPLTKAVNKQLLPIYDKPLIFYPLSILMLAKIKNILIIVNKGQLDQYKKIIPNGDNLGINITYKEQETPKGLPDAFILGEKFIQKSNVALILGDNFFYGQNLPMIIKNILLKSKNHIFLYRVKDSSNFGNRSGGKFFGDLNSEVSGRPFVFSNRNETAILEKLFEDYNKMDAEASRKPFADIIEINDFDGNKKEIKNEDLLEAFSPYKSVKWTPISIVPIKIDNTDAASGVMVYSNEKRISKNGAIWEKELMEIFYFNLDGKISSITQFAR